MRGQRKIFFSYVDIKIFFDDYYKMIFLIISLIRHENRYRKYAVCHRDLQWRIFAAASLLHKAEI